MLFVYSTNILKPQNYHLDYFFLGPLSRFVVHIIVEPALSALNSQRYMYNRIPSPACEKYAAPNEDSYHLLFVCPAYAVPRQALTLSLNLMLPADTLNNKKTS